MRRIVVLFVPLLGILLCSTGCIEIVGPWLGGNGLDLTIIDGGSGSALYHWNVTVDVNPHFLGTTDINGFVRIPTGDANRVHVFIEKNGMTEDRWFTVSPGYEPVIWRT